MKTKFLAVLGMLLASSAMADESRLRLDAAGEIQLPLQGFGKAHFSSDATFVLAYQYVSNQLIWRDNRSGAVKSLKAPLSARFEIADLSDDGMITSAMTDTGELFVWRWNAKKPLLHLKNAASATEVPMKIQVTADQKHVAVLILQDFELKRVEAFSIADGKSVYRNSQKNSGGFALSPDGKKLTHMRNYDYEQDLASMVSVDLTQGKVRSWKLQDTGSRPEAITYSPSGEQLLSANGPALIDLPGGQVRYRWSPVEDGGIASPNFRKFSSDSRYLALAGLATLTWVVDTQTGSHWLAPEGSNVTCLAFSPDGALLAGGNGPEMNVWAITSQGGVRARATTGGCYGAAFSADSAQLMSVGEDWVLRTWSTK